MAHYELKYYGIELALDDKKKLLISDIKPNSFEASIVPIDNTQNFDNLTAAGSDLAEVILNVSNQYLALIGKDAEDALIDVDPKIHNPPIWFHFNFWKNGKIYAQKTVRGHGSGSQLEPPFRNADTFYEVLVKACTYMHEW